MENTTQPAYSSPEIEIDLRPYIKAIFNGWWLIGLCAFLAVLTAFLFSALRSEAYTAESNVSLLELSVQVVLDERITTTDQSLTASNDDDSRPEALLALANSGAIRAKVIGDIRDDLGLGEDDSLSVQLSAQRQGDLIRFLATHEESEIAAMVANAWSSEFVVAANRAFVSTGSDLQESQGAATVALGEYQMVQSEFEAFVMNDQVDRIITEHNYVKSLLEQLYDERRTAFILANTTEVRLNNRLLNSTQEIVSQQVDDAVRQELRQLEQEYNYWYARKETLEQAQLEFTAVQAQLESGMRLQSEIVSEGLAELIQDSGIAALDNNNIFELNLSGLIGYTTNDLDASTTGNIPLRELFPALNATDVSVALTSVQNELIIAEQEVERLSQELLLSSNIDDVPLNLPDENRLYDLIDTRITELLSRTVEFDPRSPELQESPLNAQLNNILGYKQELEAQILNLQEERQRLEREKNTAWELYVTLDNKAREVETQFATGAPQARLALSAFPPTQPNRLPVWSLPAALLIGSGVGLALVLGIVIRKQVFDDDEAEEKSEVQQRIEGWFRLNEPLTRKQKR